MKTIIEVLEFRNKLIERLNEIKLNPGNYGETMDEDF